jgi:hypothetical protein
MKQSEADGVIGWILFSLIVVAGLVLLIKLLHHPVDLISVETMNFLLNGVGVLFVCSILFTFVLVFKH